MKCLICKKEAPCRKCMLGTVAIVAVIGVVIVLTMLKGGFQNVRDAGNACGKGSDCQSGICDFSSAVETCTLINKVNTTGTYTRFGGNEFYNANYSCSTDKPGMCTDGSQNRLKSDTNIHYFRMEGSMLVEIVTPGPQN